MNSKVRFTRLKKNPKVKVFLIFLILSAIFWFFTTLSEQYSYLTDFNLNYKNIPKNLVYQETPMPTIKVQIKASGFKILSHKLLTKQLDIDVSKCIKKDNFGYYYLPNAQLPILQQQLNDTELIKFTKDSIFLYLGTLKSKKLPVKSMLNLQFEPGYKLTQPISIDPDSILVEGPEKFISSIEQLQTQVINLSDIKQNFSQKVGIQLPNENTNELVFETKEVLINGQVAKYTQGEIEVPIKVLEIPISAQIELFPKTVLIRYQVTFENYEKINKQSFMVTCLYPKDSSKVNKTLKLEMRNKPSYITDYTIVPKQVTYLIKK